MGAGWWVVVVAGCRGRVEFGGREKVKMCIKIRRIQKEVASKFHDRSELFIQTTANRAIRKEFPHFRRYSDIKKFIDGGGLRQESIGQ